jgi:uncharacterized protein (TIGR00255 family)
MLKSMTGFGRGEWKARSYHYTVEVRSVNHRYLEVRARLPRRLAVLEPLVQREVERHCARGRVDVGVTEREVVARPRALRVDHALAAEYLRALRGLQGELGLPGEVSVELLGGLPDVLAVEEPAEEDAGAAWEELRAALEVALGALQAMRASEGQALVRELGTRLAEAEEAVARARRRAPEVVAAHRERLTQRIAALLDGRPVDSGRLEQEVALLADRSDVTEECARLESHLDQFRAILDGPGPHGRRLDFLCQEIHREANTLGAKANDAALAQVVVALKTEVEKLREQVQNVE